MKPFESALLLVASCFVFNPLSALAQVPEHVTAVTPIAPVGRSQTERSKAMEDERTREIESTRSDIADLSKFEHGNEYLPKVIYKRNYEPDDVVRPENAAMVAGHERPNYGVEHHM